MKVFIVEDAPAVLERLQEMVHELEGFELVGHAATYDAAVTGILSTRPDVSILDINLADSSGSGIDVLGRVRAVLPAMRAIMLTNYVTPQHVKTSADAGAEFYLEKSSQIDRLTGILKQMTR